MSLSTCGDKPFAVDLFFFLLLRRPKPPNKSSIHANRHAASWPENCYFHILLRIRFEFVGRIRDFSWEYASLLGRQYGRCMEQGLSNWLDDRFLNSMFGVCENNQNFRINSHLLDMTIFPSTKLNFLSDPKKFFSEKFYTMLRNWPISAKLHKYVYIFR